MTTTPCSAWRAGYLTLRAILAALVRLARTLARRQQLELARQARHTATLIRENSGFFARKA